MSLETITIAEEPQDLSPEQERILAQLLEAGQDLDQAREWVIDYVEPAAAKFAVSGLSSANWVMKRLAECEADEAEVRAMIDAEIESIRQRAERILQPIARKREFFSLVYGPQLEEFAKDRLEGQKTRSLKLLHGTIGFRKSPDKVVIDDEAAAIAALELLAVKDPDVYADAVRLRKEVAKTVVKTIFQVNGMRELYTLPADIDDPSWVPTVAAHLEGGEDKFYTKPEMPEAVQR